MDLSKLKDYFAPQDIEWRLQQCGKSGNGKIWGMALAYVTNRAIMNRLDEVCGPENWCNKFDKAPDGGVMCGISIKINGEWVTKWDGAENTDIEAVKGGLSGSMKRAAVQWGIGRYLYNLEESWITPNENGKHRGKTKDGTNFKWDDPALPEWALPSTTKREPKTKVEPKTVVKPEVKKSMFTDAQKKAMAEWKGAFSEEELATFKAQIKADDADVNGIYKMYEEEYKKRTTNNMSEETVNGASAAFGN